MKINKVRYQNFFSAKDITVNFDDYQGITIIEGENGSGKSILFEAVVWAITGRSIRKSTEESMVNNQTKKNCQVEIWINDNIYIKRSRKPTSLEFQVDGENRSREDAKNTQEQIDKTLKTSYKVLLASMVFGQHSDIDFLGASLDDKRTIIRTFLNLEEVFEIRDKIKNHKSKHQINKKASSALLEENLARQSKLVLQIEDLNKDLPKVPRISLATILKREQDAQREYNNSQIQIKKLRDLEGSFAKLQHLIDKGVYQQPEVCPTCKTTNIITQTEEDLNKLRGEQENLRRRCEWLSQDIKKHKELVLDKITIPITSQEYSKLENAIGDKKQVNSWKAQLKDLKTREEEIRQDQLKSISSYEVMRFWETAFSEKGLLQYVIKNVLKYFNTRCNTYLYHIANGKYYIEFDEQLAETIWTEKRTLIFHSLSGGQKRMINLSVMLALQDLLSLTGTDRTDLLFFDEIGENLSEASLYGLYILLQELKKNGKKIFLITHNDRLKSLLDFNTTITVSMTDGITTIR